MLDSVFRTSKNYYPQMFLEECKYGVKEKKFLSILLVIEISSDSGEENPDEGNSDEKNSDEGN